MHEQETTSNENGKETSVPGCLRPFPSPTSEYGKHNRKRSLLLEYTNFFSRGTRLTSPHRVFFSCPGYHSSANKNKEINISLLSIRNPKRKRNANNIKQTRPLTFTLHPRGGSRVRGGDHQIIFRALSTGCQAEVGNPAVLQYLCKQTLSPYHRIPLSPSQVARGQRQ